MSYVAMRAVTWGICGRAIAGGGVLAITELIVVVFVLLPLPLVVVVGGGGGAFRALTTA